MKATPIPPRSRRVVQEREGGLCFICGLRGSEWHHRRSRSVRDELTHSPANGILLCRHDHKWVHQNPREARDGGWIVSRYADPLEVSAKRWDGAWCLLDDSGTVEFTKTERG